MNNSWVRLSAWEALWKSLWRGAFGALVILWTQLSLPSSKWEVLVPNMGFGTKLPGPMFQLHHLLAALNVFHLLLQIFLYYPPSVLCSKRLNSMNRSKAPLASGFQFSSGNGEPQRRKRNWEEAIQKLIPLLPPWWSTMGSSKGHVFSWVASSYVSLSLGSGNHSLFLLFQTYKWP